MMRCKEGHFYDVARHTACPWCTKAFDAGRQAPAAAGAEGKTRPLVVMGSPVAAPRPVAVGPGTASDHAPTRRINLQPNGVDPVVGWLVCVDGPEKGRDYRLHAERNFIGRAVGMDVSLARDAGVSRERHAILSFEPRKKSFWLHPGESSGLVYRNGEMVSAPVQVESGDVIEVGKSKLVVVPFLSEHRTW